jgi:hypothetical protein
MQNLYPGTAITSTAASFEFTSESQMMFYGDFAKAA